jgi:hypothetical protein
MMEEDGSHENSPPPATGEDVSTKEITQKLVDTSIVDQLQDAAKESETSLKTGQCTEWQIHLFPSYEQLSPGLDRSQGTDANGRGALSDWPCALKNSFHIFHLPTPCPTEMALKMGALQFSYVKPCIPMKK